MNRPVVYSVASGCVWAVIGFAIAWSVAPLMSTPVDVAREFSGGLVAAPVIGMLVGALSRRFAELQHSARVGVAVVNLYLAAWLFLVAANVVRLLTVQIPWSSGFDALVFDPAVGAVLGLTYTGYVVLLGPLSYLNHVLVGRAWSGV